MKIIHIINSLKKGGAEGNLYRLCEFHKRQHDNKIDITIITLIDNGYYEDKLKKTGIKIFSLSLDKKNNLFDLIKKIFKLRKLINMQNPNVIQSWMYHSNFMTLFIQKKFYDKIFWNIRHTKLNLRFSKKMTILLSIICGIFSKIVPKKIIYCSEGSAEFHEKKHFYTKNKTKLIDNGYSEKTYYPSENQRSIFRQKYKINKTDIILGFAGRYTSEKNINSLLFAFSKSIKNYSNLYLFMVGKDISASNQELANFVNDLKIKERVFFLGEQKNLLEFYNGIDLLVLASHSESFPNVVAEAMLCSTPVLSSDAGCAKKIINGCGFIMSSNDQRSISINLEKCIDTFKHEKNKWESLKKKSHLKIKKDYSIEKMANIYFNYWNF